MSTAYAQMGPGGVGGPPGIAGILPFVLIFGIMYLMLIRPEQKRRREHEQLLAGLKRNDQVVLAAGIHGRVTAIADKTVTLEIAPKVLIQVDRSAIQTVQGAAAAEPRDKEREKS